MLTLQSLFQSYSLAIEKKLEMLCAPDGSLLLEAARYSLFSPGKRLRPLLTLLTAEACGAPCEAALIPACAIEMIHTYSLIHDDLPCMDDDDFRRGKPSLHKAYPEGQAVLAGSFLYNKAIQIATEAASLTQEQRLQIVRCLVHSVGEHGLIGGQSLDLIAKECFLGEREFHSMIERKTACLISSCMECGAICSGASEEKISAVKRIGLKLGWAFQCADDLLDQDDSSASILSRLGAENTRAYAHALYQEAVEELHAISCGHEKLLALAESMVFRTN